MNKIVYTGLLFIGLSSGLQSSFAAETVTKSATKETATAKTAGPSQAYLSSLNKFGSFPEDTFTWTSLSDAKALKGKFDKDDRKPSSLAADESNISDEFKKFRAEFLKINNSEELSTFLESAESKYSKNELKENDTKFFAAQLLPLRSLHGIIWKMITVFQHSNVTHSLLLTTAKTVAGSMKVMLPTDQWNATFDYLTKPYIGNDKVASRQFINEGELIGWFAGPVYSSIGLAATRVSKLDFNKRPVVWDNLLLYGKASFPDALDRYRLVGEIERLTTLAAMHSALSSIAFNRAYSNEGMIALSEDEGHLYGFDGFWNGKVTGAPTSEKVKILRKAKYQSYGTLVPTDGAKWMSLSLKHLRESVRVSYAVFNQSLERTPNETFLYDNSATRTNQRAGQLRLENMVAAVEARAELRSGITGETVVFDLPNFYNFPPHDLKNFLPNHFVGGAEMLPSGLKDENGKTVADYRNYYIGRPDGWDKNAYNLVFPTAQDSKGIQEDIRILSQTWGTGVIAGSFSSLIQ